MGKTFTLDEAQTLLPVLGALLERARASAVRAGNAQMELQSLSQRIYLAGGMHVDIAAAARTRAEGEKATTEARVSIQEIEEIGARVGEMEEGRLEFPSPLDGREVLLCWTLGEEMAIRHWREDKEGSELQELSDGPGRRERPN